MIVCSYEKWVWYFNKKQHIGISCTLKRKENHWQQMNLSCKGALWRYFRQTKNKSSCQRVSSSGRLQLFWDIFSSCQIWYWEINTDSGTTISLVYMTARHKQCISKWNHHRGGLYIISAWVCWQISPWIYMYTAKVTLWL